jgi:hypothetical protein
LYIQLEDIAPALVATTTLSDSLDGGNENRWQRRMFGGITPPRVAGDGPESGLAYFCGMLIDRRPKQTPFIMFISGVGGLGHTIVER